MFVALYGDILGIQSPLGVQPLINDPDIATLMDPQEILHTTQYYYYNNIIMLVAFSPIQS